MGVVNLSDFQGCWLILFSYPADFMAVCTNKFVALSKASDRLRRWAALARNSADERPAQAGQEIPFPARGSSAMFAKIF
ncbi:MAG: redoxin domain-containing protein [Myxococcota bacterium]|jgi:peroxiredoxin